ncbi:MAG: histidine kinase [Eubacteriales bacterium]|nr:histidine kinase [Eubacteriales bacterium]
MKDLEKENRLTLWLRKLPIFPRLLAVFCVLLVLSVLFITGINQKSLAAEAEKTSLDTLSLLVQNAAYKLHQETERFEDLMAKFLRNNALLAQFEEPADQNGYSADRSKVEHELLKIMKADEGIRALIFVSDNVQYRTAVGVDTPRGPLFRDIQDFYNSELYKAAEREEGYPAWVDATGFVSKIIFDKPQDTYGIVGCFALCYKVYSPNTRKPIGYLVCCVTPQALTNALPEYASKNSGNTFLVGQGGALEGIMPELSAPPFVRNRAAFVNRVFATERDRGVLFENRKQLLFASSRVGNLPLAIVNLSYRDFALSNVHRMQKTNLLIALSVIIIGAIGFYFTTVSIVRPVKRLSYAMKQVGQGDFSEVYTPESDDEIGALCKAFNAMVADMQQLIDQVYGAKLRENAMRLNEKTAQLDMLQMQISPHFLYNTLDLIRWQCLNESGINSCAGSMVEKFSTLMRMTIRGEKTKESLHEAFSHAQVYLEVVNFRFQNPIALLINASDNVMDALVPCMSIQPILENAVRHAFLNGDQARRRIEINVTVEEKQMLIQVSDNGVGMDEKELSELQRVLQSDHPTHSGIGMKNVHERLRLYYGKDAGVQVESQKGKGTDVTIVLPLEFDEEERRA